MKNSGDIPIEKSGHFSLVVAGVSNVSGLPDVKILKSDLPESFE
jgi:hypothetical protein